MCLTADPGVTSSILTQSHTFVEIDHEIISTANLLPSSDSPLEGSGRVLDSRPRGRGFEPHRGHSLCPRARHINPSS